MNSSAAAVVKTLLLGLSVSLFGWESAALGYPVLVPVTATAVLVFGFSAALRRLPGKVVAGDLAAVKRQLVDLSAQRDEATSRAAAASARAAAAAELASRVEENVRASIVAELHDTVTQTLVASAFATQDPTIDRDELGVMMRTAERELRHVMVNESPLRSSVNLSTQVSLLLERMARRSDFHVDLDWDVEEDLVLPHPTAIAVYRFIGESLRNTRRHAGVDTARVSLRVTDSELLVEVDDKGVGFDPDRASAGRGLDLLRARCAVVAGRVCVESGPERGTRLVLAVPR